MINQSNSRGQVLLLSMAGPRARCFCAEPGSQKLKGVTQESWGDG